MLPHPFFELSRRLQPPRLLLLTAPEILITPGILSAPEIWPAPEIFTTQRFFKKLALKDFCEKLERPRCVVLRCG